MPLNDVVAPELTVLFVGINPGLRSEATGHHFAGASNRFWKTLHGAGFTPTLLTYEQDAALPQHGIGITNIAPRPTRAAAELTDDELRDGAQRLERLVTDIAPRWVAMVGITAYRTAFDRPKAQMGRQPDEIGGRPVWALPNPSGLNGHYSPDRLVAVYADFRAVAQQ